jgi:hypothetical protein
VAPTLGRKCNSDNEIDSRISLQADGTFFRRRAGAHSVPDMRREAALHLSIGRAQRRSSAQSFAAHRMEGLEGTP